MSFPWSPLTLTQRVSDTKKLLESNSAAGRSVFTQLFNQSVDQESKLASTQQESSLTGAIISVKDLFDVKGYLTQAGTRFMADDPVASRNADAIEALSLAGASLLGHTNMTELAYSGLGLNPHNGTPENALFPGCIPGGSTSGGAISVARGFADIAIGSDTGGSLRIPAAFNGIVGFKPTQATVSRRGCKTLSHSLDSVGPMARTVEACELAFRVMSALGNSNHRPWNPSFVIPQNYGLDDMDSTVAREFDSAISMLSRSGYDVKEQSLDSLEQLKSLAVWQLAAVESRSEYDEFFRNARDVMDPRVWSRMARADEVNAIEYRKTLNQRQTLIQHYQADMKNRILLLPTVPIMPPTLSALELDDEQYNRVNLLALRNPSIANVMDGCSISLPFGSGANTIGIMLTSNGLTDLQLLHTATQISKIFQTN